MPFKLVLNYRKNSGDNLVYKIEDDGLRNETLNSLLDFIETIKPQIKRSKDKKIIDVINTYRRSHFDYLEQEIKTGTSIGGQMEITLDFVSEQGEEKSIGIYNHQFRRTIVDLDRKISEFVKEIKYTDEESGKEIYQDVIELLANYVPVVGGIE